LGTKIGNRPAVLAAYKADNAAAAETTIHLEGSDSDHGHLLITNAGGQKIGWSGGKYVDEIPGARIEFSDAGQDWHETIEPDYTVPDGAYTVTLDGTALKSADDSAIYVIGGDYDLALTNITLHPGETDALSIAPGATSSSFKAGQAQQPAVAVGVSDDTADYAFAFAGAEQQAGETINLALPPESGNLTVGTTGAAGTGTYALVMDREDAQGKKEFKHDNLQLSSGDTAELQVGSWDGGHAPIPLVITHNGATTTEQLTDQGAQ
jgi:hypothetical protein